MGDFVSQEAIHAKRKEIDAIRRAERGAGLDAFTRGQLAGAQQAFYWCEGEGMEPVRAILSDPEIERIELAGEGVADG